MKANGNKVFFIIVLSAIFFRINTIYSQSDTTEISDNEALEIFASLGDMNSDNCIWKRTSPSCSGRGTASKFERKGDIIEVTFFAGTTGGGEQTMIANVNGNKLTYNSWYQPSIRQYAMKKVVLELVSRTKIKGIETESGWVPGKVDVYNFEYILK